MQEEGYLTIGLYRAIAVPVHRLSQVFVIRLVVTKQTILLCCLASRLERAW